MVDRLRIHGCMERHSIGRCQQERRHRGRFDPRRKESGAPERLDLRGEDASKFGQELPDPRAQKPVPPPLPPEYTPEALIEEQQIPTAPLAHDPGWERAGADAVT